MTKYRNKINIFWLLFAFFSGLAAIIIGAIGFYEISQDYRNFHAEATRIRNDYMKNYQNIIRSEVGKVIDDIQFSWSKTEESLKSSIKARTYDAHSIASNLYHEHQGRLPDADIRKIILDALRPIRYNNGRGYYFAVDYNGMEILFADHPELEGGNLLDMRDTRGAYVLRDLIDLVRRDGEGYYQYTWTKPNAPGRDFPKISYVKRFDPFNGFIGTGEYLDDVEKDIKEEVLDRIAQIRFGREGYIFVVSYDGVMFLNRAQPELVRQNIWDLTDPQGIKVIQEMRRIVEKPEGSFLSYHWMNPSSNKQAPKMSFVKGFGPWEWIVGAGIYTDEIDTMIAAREAELRQKVWNNGFFFAALLLGLLCCALLFSYFLTRYLKRQFDVFLSFFKNMETGGTPISSDRIFLREFALLGGSVNAMLAKRRQAEEALQKEMNKTQQYLDIAGVIMLVLDISAQVILVNKKGCEILGYKEDEILGKNWFDHFIPVRDREQVKNVFQEIIGGKEEMSEYFENNILCKNGEEKLIEWHNRVVRDDNGMIIGTLSSGKNITGRKKAEDALRARTEELEALFSMSAALRSARNADEMLPKALDEIHRVLKADAGAVILLTPDGTHFTIALADGPLAPNTGRKFGKEQGISGQIFRTRQPYVTDDYAMDPLKISGLQGANELGPTVLVPLQSETEFLGVLLESRFKGSLSPPFTSAEVCLLTAMGEMVGNALRRARLHDQALTRLEHVHALHSIDMAISTSLDIRVTLDVLLTKVASQLGVDAADVLLFYPETLTLEYAAGLGFRTRAMEGTILRLGEDFAGRVALEKRNIHVPNLLQDSGSSTLTLLHTDEGFFTYYGVPLTTNSQVKGVLEIFHRSPLTITDEWIEFLEALAAQAAIAIDNAQLFNDLQRSHLDLSLAYDTTLEGWTRALDLRDKETEGHTLRVADMTLHLARSMGLAEEQLVHIRRGALLHDIGKMGVPDSILFKPGKLTEEEWAIMRRHPQYAYDLLSPITYLQPALDIPYCHHEKWDGTGYPRGLKGEGITLAARIFAVVDVWDALTSNRPYRDAWPKNRALEYILEQTGKHFEPRILDIFSTIIKREPKEPSMSG